MAEPIIVSVSDCPVSFLGDRKETMFLRLDDKPQTRDDWIKAVEDALGFPLCQTDEARANVLTLWAVDPTIPVELGLENNPLRLCGGDDARDYIKSVLENAPINGQTKVNIGQKLLQTLRDGQQHSFIAVMEYRNKYIIICVRTHAGSYSQKAQSCHGQFGTPFAALKDRVPAERISAMLCLDYFVEDADKRIGRDFYLFLAVNWFPLKLEGVPPGNEVAVVQLEMFPEKEWFGLQQLFRGDAPVIRALDRQPVASSTRTPHIFLSHNSDDKPVVRRLAEYLNQLGIDAWLDEWEMEVGDSLRRSVGAALEKSRYVGVIITPAFLNSQWCMDELDQALAREKREGGKTVIPMLFGTATPPAFVEGRLHLDFQRDFFSALVQLCGFIYQASPKRVASALAEQSPQTLDDVRSLVRHFGWENYAFVDKEEFEELRRQVARLGVNLLSDDLVLTKDIVARLGAMGVNARQLNRLIG